jgi:hypothetical protein
MIPLILRFRFEAGISKNPDSGSIYLAKKE